MEFEEANNAFTEWRTYTLKTIGNTVELDKEYQDHVMMRQEYTV